MLYQDFVTHLDSENCTLEDPENPRGSVCINLINSKHSFVVKSDRLFSITVVVVCYNLGIACPHVYEDDYEVYSLFMNKEK